MTILNKILKEIPVINPKANYWFVRTEGGSLYRAFLANNLIAVGYRKISISDIRNATRTDEKRDSLKEAIAQKYPDHRVPGLVASQLRRFVFELRKNDFVVIPSQSSDALSIGLIESDEPFIKELNVTDSAIFEEFNKCISVKWLKHVNKSKINPNLYKLTTSHQAIFSANDYAQWIDSAIYDFYEKNGQYHLVMEVEKEDAIKAKAFFRFYLDLLELGERFCKAYKIDYSTENIDALISLNSPGQVELKGAGYVLVGIGLILVGLGGGGYEAKLLGFKLESGGIVKAVNEFKNDEVHRKLVEEVTKKLHDNKIKRPNDLIKVINAVNGTNQ